MCSSDTLSPLLVYEVGESFAVEGSISVPPYVSIEVPSRSGKEIEKQSEQDFSPSLADFDLYIESNIQK